MITGSVYAGEAAHIVNGVSVFGHRSTISTKKDVEKDERLT
jgi:hypothetical protein